MPIVRQQLHVIHVRMHTLREREIEREKGGREGGTGRESKFIIACFANSRGVWGGGGRGGGGQGNFLYMA